MRSFSLAMLLSLAWLAGCTEHVLIGEGIDKPSSDAASDADGSDDGDGQETDTPADD